MNVSIHVYDKLQNILCGVMNTDKNYFTLRYIFFILNLFFRLQTNVFIFIWTISIIFLNGVLKFVKKKKKEKSNLIN